VSAFGGYEVCIACQILWAAQDWVSLSPRDPEGDSWINEFLAAVACSTD